MNDPKWGELDREELEGLLGEEWKDLVDVVLDRFVGDLEVEGEKVLEEGGISVYQGGRGVYVVFPPVVVWIRNLSGIELNSIVYTAERAKDKRKAFAELIVEYVVLKKAGFLGRLKP
ncbi:MAG: hypothetical protein ACP5HQ_07270 [Thermoprotei archaeon]